MADDLAAKKDLVVVDVKEIVEETRPPVQVRFRRDARPLALAGLTFEADWSPEIQGYLLPWSRLPVIASDDGRFNVMLDDVEFTLVFHRHTSIGLVILPSMKTHGHEWDDGSSVPRYDWAEMSRRRDEAEDVAIELERRGSEDEA